MFWFHGNILTYDVLLIFNRMIIVVWTEKFMQALFSFREWKGDANKSFTLKVRHVLFFYVFVRKLCTCVRKSNISQRLIKSFPILDKLEAIHQTAIVWQ